jgi:hypothetical protein
VIFCACGEALCLSFVFLSLPLFLPENRYRIQGRSQLRPPSLVPLRRQAVQMRAVRYTDLARGWFVANFPGHIKVFGALRAKGGGSQQRICQTRNPPGQTLWRSRKNRLRLNPIVRP